MARDRLIAQDLYSYAPCGLPTGDFMPAEQAQIRLMTASPVTLIPAPDQVTPEQAYFHDLNFYKKTLFHSPFLSRGRAITLQEYKDAEVQLEVDAWFNTLPSAVQQYLLPFQSTYTTWFNDSESSARPSAEIRLLQMVSSEDSESSASLHATPRALEDDLVQPIARLPSLLAQ